VDASTLTCIPEWGPWKALRLHCWPEDHLDLVLTTTRERKVRTAEELDAALKEPMKVAQLETSGFTRAWRMGRSGYLTVLLCSLVGAFLVP